MMDDATFTKEQVIPKIKQYCAYQERCYSEVKEKLSSFNLYAKDIEEIISVLIEKNYLNEERFATQFAGGKFRMVHWGKTRIKHALRQKQVSDHHIKKALDQIDDKDYLHTLDILARKKLQTLNGERNIFIRKKKLERFLLQKGYENYLVNELVKQVTRTGQTRL